MSVNVRPLDERSGAAFVALGILGPAFGGGVFFLDAGVSWIRSALLQLLSRACKAGHVHSKRSVSGLAAIAGGLKHAVVRFQYRAIIQPIGLHCSFEKQCLLMGRLAAAEGWWCSGIKPKAPKIGYYTQTALGWQP